MWMNASRLWSFRFHWRFTWWLDEHPIKLSSELSQTLALLLLFIFLANELSIWSEFNFRKLSRWKATYEEKRGLLCKSLLLTPTRSDRMHALLLLINIFHYIILYILCTLWLGLTVCALSSWSPDDEHSSPSWNFSPMTNCSDHNNQNLATSDHLLWLQQSSELP